MEIHRIVLADDHSLFRQGIRRILQERPDLEVVGEASDGLELLELINKLNPHLVIVDISMPNLRGIETIHEIRNTHSNVKILMLTMHNDREYFYQSVSAGADGYFLKKDTDTELLTAIEKILRGGMYVSPSLSDAVGDLEKIAAGFRKPILTIREREVLRLIAEGKQNQEIASLLFISVHTVERHRANILGKLNLKGTAELVRYAFQKGLIQEE